jgi:hypothetical protein
MNHPEKQPPLGITVTQKEQYLEIVYTRPSVQFTSRLYYLFLLVFMIGFFNSFQVSPSFMGVVVGSVVCMVYLTLTTWFNKLHIFITPQKLIVRYKPFFQLGNKEIPLSHIKEVRCQDRLIYDGANSIRGDGYKGYKVTALTAVKYGGLTEELFYTPVPQDAEYIQQKIMLLLADV